MGIQHQFTSTKSDGGDTTLVRPSDWNADHVGFDIEDYAGTITSDISKLVFPRGKVIDLGSGVVSIRTDVGAGDLSALGTYGDECDTTTPDAAWAGRNIPSVTGNGNGYPLVMDAQGDAYLRSFTDPAADFMLMAHITGLTNGGGMVGLTALNSSGTGVTYSVYNDGNTYVWQTTTYGYSGTGSANGAQPLMTNHWLMLRRVGTSWSGRYSTDGTAWSNWTSGDTNTQTITQIGILRAYVNGGTHSPILERFVYGTTSIILPF